jgi:hypothetical protein
MADPDMPDGGSSEVEDAERSFDDSERSLRDTLARAAGDENEESGPLRAAPPRPSADAMRNRPAAPRARCGNACRALASMTRAAERLCHLAGDNDRRCRDVRDRTRSARRTVERNCASCRNKGA